jgi:hypothetical protein
LSSQLFFLFVRSSFAFDFFWDPLPRIRDLQQRGFVLWFHALRQSSAVFCIFSKLDNILHRMGL